MRLGRRSRTLAVALAVLAVLSPGCGGGGADLAGPALGSLDVTTATSGPEPDADGYAVSLDGAAAEAIGANATARHDGLSTGAHTLELSGVAANCTVSPAARQSVSVSANAVAAAEFAVACAPTTGTIQVTTTAGVPADPDGYQLLLDGAAAQPIGTAAVVTLPGITPGSHTVALGGLAAGCAAAGDNPRAVAVTAGSTAVVTFSVTCAPPPPTAGTLQIATHTTGAQPDADGYTYAVDGGAAQPIGANATASVAGLAAGNHSVALAGAAGNCAIGAPNPRTAAVPAGGSVNVTFAVTCSATAGRLQITIGGLPAGVNAAVVVTGPGGFTSQLTATGTLAELQPGTYTVSAAAVTSGGTSYAASPASRNAAVAAGETRQVTVTYGAVPGPSVNLRIDGWYLSQSTQSPAGDVPLVTNRDGYLRVFVVADKANRAAPSVRVQLFRSGALAGTFTIRSPSSSTPTGREEGRLASSWNLKIPRELIAPGLSVLAEVDPENLVAETDESDNRYPVSGAPQAQVVHDAPVLGLTFVPVRQQANGLMGDVSVANKAKFLELSRRMHPLPGADGDVHAVYTTTTDAPLTPDDANGAWSDILGELNALRIAEGNGRTYYGVVRIDYPSGIAGVGYIGTPTAMGYDREFDRSRVMAHELGHTWGRPHAPCGNPGGPDPNYPYPGGVIGVFGIDMQNEVLKDPATPDIMGYCGDPWISDYTYRNILAFRDTAAEARAAFTTAQPCLLIWGKIVDGRAVLEPAFQLLTRPSPPKAPGPYTVEGLTTDGARMFGFSFEPAQVADDPRGARRFAFAVPLGPAAAAGLASLRLSGPAGPAAAERTAPPAAAARTASAIEARRVAGGVALRWDAAASPMIMVRDPATGEVLSFARGGRAEVVTGKTELDLTVSDRVGSQELRVSARP